jgi:UDP-N-acetylglucosamine 2-epimerase (non-hydrolysing)
MLIHLIAAARPNFMKIAPLYHALKRENWAIPYIVHTGQHYDLNMSDAFFNDLDLPKPDLNLGVGSGSHAEQTGHVMINYEKVLLDQKPDLVVVVGDVNSTMACAIAASKVQYLEMEKTNKLNKPNRPIVAHLEAGLRSFDRTMPEEINRLVTDALADILWTPSQDADRNLEREGIQRERIHRVGNIMIDSLEMLRPRIEKIDIWKKFNLSRGAYGLVTLHRPSNVDNHGTLETICRILMRIAGRIPLLFPVHPRTRKNLEDNGILGEMGRAKNLFLSEPLSYIPFMNLVFNCRFAITDSGGIQEETTYLGIPCLTMRPNTERPITISNGTNRLCSPENLESEVERILSGKQTQKQIPEYWDGHTAERVVKSITRFFG